MYKKIKQNLELKRKGEQNLIKTLVQKLCMIIVFGIMEPDTVKNKVQFNEIKVSRVKNLL